MSNTPCTREEFEAAMQKGFDWDERCRLVGDLINWHLMDRAPGRTHRNGELCREILRALGYKVNIRGWKASNPFYRPLANVITHLGKQPENSEIIRQGKEIRCGTSKKGQPVYARERLWVWDDGNFDPKEYALIEQGYDPAPKADTVTISVKEYEDLCQRAMTSIVSEGLDKRDISRHPKPGYSPKTCPTCGQGRVYTKENS